MVSNLSQGGYGPGAPVPGSNAGYGEIGVPIKEVTRALEKNTKAVDEGNKHSIKNNDLLDKNVEAFKSLLTSLKDFGNVANNLRLSFNKADDLQRKSLAIGTNLNKLLGFNSEALKNLRGSYLENAEEMLKNFSTGIRENSDGLNTLQNRMRLTDQSTDITRKVMGDLQMETGNSIEAVDRLSRTNIDLSKSNHVLNESILEMVNATKQLREVPSFLGLSENIAELTSRVGAAVGPKGASEVARVMEFFFSPEGLSQRITLGVGNATDRLLDPALTGNELFSEFMSLSKIATDNLRKIVSLNNSSLKIENAALQLNSIGDSGVLVALNNLTKVIDHQNGIQNEFTKFQENRLDSVKTLEEEARNFYQKYTGPLYSMLMTGLPLLLGGSIGANIGGLAGIFSGKAGNILKVVGGFAGALLGPLGLIGGLATTFGPDIYDYFTDSTSTSKKQLEELKRINEREDQRDRKDVPSTTSGNFTQFIANNLRDIVTMSTSKPNKQLEELSSQLDELIKLQRKTNSKISAPTTPGIGG